MPYDSIRVSLYEGPYKAMLREGRRGVVPGGEVKAWMGKGGVHAGIPPEVGSEKGQRACGTRKWGGGGMRRFLS